MSRPDVPDAFGDADPQDSAEVFDETNYDEREENNEMKTFEEMPDVYDATSAEGDADEDEELAFDASEFNDDVVDALDDELLDEDDETHSRAAIDDPDDTEFRTMQDGFNEDALDDDEIEGLDEDVEDADMVTGGEDDVTNFQAKAVSDDDLKRMGYSEDRRGETRAKPDQG